MSGGDDDAGFIHAAAELGAGEDDFLQLVEALPKVTPTAQLRDAILREASFEGRFARFAAATAELLDLDLGAAQALLDRVSEAKNYAPNPLMPGVSNLWVEGGPRVANAFRGFTRVVAGGVIRSHTHLGEERTLVLQGAYEDLETGLIVRAGEMARRPAGSTHALRALPGRPDLLKLVVLWDGIEVEGKAYRAGPAR